VGHRRSRPLEKKCASVNQKIGSYAAKRDASILADGIREDPETFPPPTATGRTVFGQGATSADG
jgi:hypothetical protein